MEQPKGMPVKTHPLYSTWRQLRQRCNNSNHIQHNNYGGRGITVCDEWNNSFYQFLEDMGDRPTPSHQIDRINNNKGYSRDNCRWVTRSENYRNKRNNVYVTFNGKECVLANLYDDFQPDMSYDTFSKRIHRGWDLMKALSTPIK